MTQISEAYREQNRQLHETNASYGAGEATSHWFPMVAHFAQVIGAASILDYGCGKGKMRRELSSFMIIPYDPCVPEFSDEPDAHDLVVCLDVLEHVEPELLDSVLDDIQRLAQKAVFLTVHMGAAIKTLPDGRNAHLIQQPISWWLPKLMQRWDLTAVRKPESFEFLFTGRPHAMNDAEVARRSQKLADLKAAEVRQ